MKTFFDRAGWDVLITVRVRRVELSAWVHWSWFAIGVRVSRRTFVIHLGLLSVRANLLRRAQRVADEAERYLRNQAGGTR